MATSWVRDDYSLVFRARTPLHVGGAGADGVVDLPLARDGRGQTFIPGSSWAGVLRALARRLKLEHEMTIFGSERGAKDGYASRLSVFDAPLVGDTRVALRTGVRIDPHAGTAADGLLYDRLVLPPGERIRLELRYEGPLLADMEALIAAVRATGLRVGAAGSRGLGRLDCVSAHCTRAALDSRDDVLTLLAGRARQVEIEPAGEGNPAGVIRIELGWRPRRAVRVGVGEQGANVQLLPLLTHTPSGGLVPVLPGSSIKGVARSYVERVLRTLVPDKSPEDLPAFEATFGSCGRAGALSIADVAAEAQPVGDEEWRQYVRGEGTAPAGWKERQHIAIDRWSGGVAPHRLFTVLEPRVWNWQPIEFEIDLLRLDKLPGPAKEAAVVLVGLAVAELREGGLGFGAGTGRGLGEIEVRSLRVHGADLVGRSYSGDWWAWLRGVADGRKVSELVQEVAGSG